MTTTYGLTPAGYTAPRQADYLTIFKNSYESRLVAVGETVMPDWDRDVFLGTIAEIVSFALGQQSEANQAVYDARSEANATGLQLANLSLIAGIERQESTKGVVTLRCIGVNGTVVTQGKICEGGGDDDKARWIAAQDGTIGSVTSGYVDLVFECEDEGEIVATPGQITTMVTPVDGWQSVTNLAAADAGQERETDSELRARKQRAPQVAGGTNTNAIRAALLTLDFVTGVTVVDNKTVDTVTTDGLTLRPKSVACVVAPDTMTDEQKSLVVTKIFEKVAGGTDTSGDESATVTKPDGRGETIRYSFAIDADVDLVWVLELEEGFVLGDVEDPLDLLVRDLFDTFTNGGTVYPTPLIALAATVDGIANVTSLTLNGAAVPVTHNATERPVLGDDDMST